MLAGPVNLFVYRMLLGVRFRRLRAQLRTMRGVIGDHMSALHGCMDGASSRDALRARPVGDGGTGVGAGDARRGPARAGSDTEDGDGGPEADAAAAAAASGGSAGRLQHLRPEHLASPPLFIAPAPARRARSERGAAGGGPEGAAPPPAATPAAPGGGQGGGAPGVTRRRGGAAAKGGSSASGGAAAGGGAAALDPDCVSPPAARRVLVLGGAGLGCGGAPQPGSGGTPTAPTPRTGYDHQTWEALMELGCAPTPRSAPRKPDADPNPGAAPRGSGAGPASAPDLASPPLVYSGSARKRCAPDCGGIGLGAGPGGGAGFARGCGGGPDGTLFSPQPLVAKRARCDGAACGGGGGGGGGEGGRCRQGAGVGLRALAAGDLSVLEQLVRPLYVSPGAPGAGRDAAAGAPAAGLSGPDGGSAGGTPGALDNLGHVRPAPSPLRWGRVG